MNNRNHFNIIILYLVSYLGFLTHLGLEAMVLHFTKDSFEPEQWTEMVNMLSSPATQWIMGVFALLSMLPILFALMAKGRKGLLTTGIFGGLMTLLHALHYGAELAEEFGGLGVASFIFHVLPSAYASWLAIKTSKEIA